MDKTKKSVIIVAGGSGTRMDSATPKQFLELAGRPVLMQTIEVFYSYDPTIEIILVLPENHFNSWEKLKTDHSFNIPHKICFGGESRYHSVLNGLKTIGDDAEIIAVHDGVRPLVSSSTIQSCFETASVKGTAIPVVNPVDSLRIANGEDSFSVNREEYRIVQTPQCFKKIVIKKAYEQDYSPKFTDDASVAESAGFFISLCEGNPENIKITRPADLIIAEALLKKAKD